VFRITGRRVQPKLSRLIALACALLAAALIAPAGALGADTYVDDDLGLDINSCLTTDAACRTIAAAIAKAGPGDTIHVDGGTYREDLTLGAGKSLVEDDFNHLDGDTEAVLDSARNTAIAVWYDDSAGSIQGLTIRGDFYGILLHGPATVSNNTFEKPGTGEAYGVYVDSGAGASVIERNRFLGSGDPDAPAHWGVSILQASPTIRDNSFTNLFVAILMEGPGAAPLLEGNEIEGSGAYDGQYGVSSEDGTPTLIRNKIRWLGEGVSIDDWPYTDGAYSGTFAKNLIVGNKLSLDAAGDVTLSGDVVQGGLQVHGTETEATASNVVLESNQWPTPAASVSGGASLALDSSIVVSTASGGGGIKWSGGGSCSISFSRGPVTVPGGSGCEDFQTSADPQFGAGWHLLPGSPLIDAGNPASPAPGETDVDGDPRALDGDRNCEPRRDMGIDEYVDPNPPSECDPPETTIDSGPGTTTTDTTPTFEFSSDEAGSSFECRIDAAPFAACSGPGASHTAGPLAAGAHRFEVRATDPIGNTDPTPAFQEFSVEVPTTPTGGGQSNPPATGQAPALVLPPVSGDPAPPKHCQKQKRKKRKRCRA
jgi:hypothetical protein